MIITCPSCNRKFKVNDELIPSEGRDLQCGSCDNVWFFKKEKKVDEPLTLINNDIKEEIRPNNQYDNNEKNQIKSYEVLKENKIYKKKVG